MRFTSRVGQPVYAARNMAILWIWATLYQPARGWGMQHKPNEAGTDGADSELAQLNQRIAELEHKIAHLQPTAPPSSTEK